MPTSLRGANTPGGVRSLRPRYGVSRAIIASTPSRPGQTLARTASLRDRFDAGTAFTIGLEEELLLLDPGSLDLAPRGPELLAALARPDRFRGELSPAQIEIVSPVAGSVGEAVAALAEGRAQAVDAAAGSVRLAGAGAHPFAEPWSAIAPGDRYAALERRYRWGARQGALAAGLHVHLGVPGADRALAVYNALRGLMPDVAALAANAPFFGGRDTGLASIRPKLADALPRQGIGPAFPSWDAVAELLAWGRASGAVPDPAELWWECRLHPGYATVEVRAPDALARLADVEAVASVVQALARWLAGRFDAGELLPAHRELWIAENRWRAATDGVEGELLDLERTQLVPARRRLSELLDALGPVARELGTAPALARAAGWLDAPHPRRHREVAARDGMRGLACWLADVTEAAAQA
jgi:glutamate---cysteine ligase / carboxylate-amine ligase